MTKKEARDIIQKAYEDLTRIYRKSHPLPDLMSTSDDELNAYLDRQDAFVNAEIFRTIPEDVRKSAI